jgi:TPR repeat protein
VPIFDFASANEELAKMSTEIHYPCCGKSICRGCVYSCFKSGNNKCPFCNAEKNKTDEDGVEDNMKRADANDAASIFVLAGYYYHGLNGVQQDQTKGMELYAKAADLGCSMAHCSLGDIYYEGGYVKKAKFHFEAAAMAGNDTARNTLGYMEAQSGNKEQAMKHWKIGASAGGYIAMHHLRMCFEKGHTSRESIDSTLAAYNTSCAEMRSEARDAYISMYTSNIVTECGQSNE